MWFSSDLGVSKYDGFEFVNYDIDNGISDNEVFKLFEDNNNRIWLLTYNGKACYIKNDTAFNSNNANFLKQFDNKDFFTEIYEDDQKQLFFFKEYANYYYSLKDTIVTKHYLPKQTFYISQIKYKNQNYLIYNCKLDNGVWKYTICSLNNSNQIILTFETKNQLSKFYCVNNVIYYIDKGETNYRNAKIISSKNINLAEKKIINTNNIEFSQCNEVFSDKETICWSTNNGLIQLNTNNNILTHLLESETATSSRKDFENGYWVTTKNNGIYYYTNKTNKLYNNINIPIFSIKNNFDNNEYAYCGEGKIAIEVNNKITIYNLPEASKTEIINDIAYLENNKILIGNGTGLYLMNNNKIEKLKSKSGIKQILLDGDSILYATSTGLIKQHKNQIKITFDVNSIPFRTLYETRSLSVAKYNNKYIIGNNNGVELINPINDTLLKQIKHRIHKIIKSSNNSIALCSDVNGVVILTENKKLKYYSIKEGLISNQVNNARFDNKNNLWVATKKGISHINTKNNIITNYGSSNGIINENIHDILPKNDTCILLATTTGIYQYNPKTNYTLTNPKIVVRNVKINSRYANSAQLNNLSYKENNIEIQLSGISYSTNQLDFYYQLNPNDEWKKINGRLLTFVNLPYGKYSVKLKCKNIFNNWSNVLAIPITIKAPFHKTWWFIISASAFLLSICIIIIYSFQKRKNKEREIKLILSETKQKALRAQLNPHFVFNALNSIQYLYLSNKEEDAQTYLSKFSVLLRNTLNQSDKISVTIHEEIETIKLYLEIEQIRSTKKFDFIFLIDENINTYNISIPSMLIQPFVENSVWHAFKTIDHLGKITISITESENDAIIINIKDNGSGYDIENTKNEKSKGTKLIFDRISALNLVNKNKITYTIKSSASGTETEFIFPKIF